ncbi:MAG: universal stress protein [Deltaproteobacteria bacterium]|nr:universal stress protein [Deltaproteobacteria bacterium]PWB67943.1 MAG: universal stress protein [Deltaproteobacteria bacterium]
MFSKILLPTDFSDCSAEAARVARQLAERFGSRIVVLHVLDEPAALDPMFRGDVPLELLRSRMEQFAQESLDAFLAAQFSGFENFDTMLAAGIPYREIIGKARECAAGLIVIGTHGRTGVEHVIFGSTAERVVRSAPCPVLTVRMGGKEFVRP